MPFRVTDSYSLPKALMLLGFLCACVCACFCLQAVCGYVYRQSSNWQRHFVPSPHSHSSSVQVLCTDRWERKKKKNPLWLFPVVSISADRPKIAFQWQEKKTAQVWHPADCLDNQEIWQLPLSLDWTWTSILYTWTALLRVTSKPQQQCCVINTFLLLYFIHTSEPGTNVYLFELYKIKKTRHECLQYSCTIWTMYTTMHIFFIIKKYVTHWQCGF